MPSAFDFLHSLEISINKEENTIYRLMMYNDHLSCCMTNNSNNGIKLNRQNLIKIK